MDLEYFLCWIEGMSTQLLNKYDILLHASYSVLYFNNQEYEQMLVIFKGGGRKWNK